VSGGHDVSAGDPGSLLAVARVAKILDVSEDTVRRRIAVGELEAVKLGYRTVRVPAASLAAYIAARIMHPEPAEDRPETA
jgi:excisionase family DNA binding protein